MMKISKRNKAKNKKENKGKIKAKNKRESNLKVIIAGMRN